MSQTCTIAVDLADVWAGPVRKKLLRTLAWGDEVEVMSIENRHLQLQFVRYEEQADGSVLPITETGYIVPSAGSGVKAAEVVRPRADNTVLRVNFVDVQQGDGAVIESPGGKVMLVDGGENQLFARYLAGRFRGTSRDRPRTIDCILVTHGDADHFSGLVQIHKSEKLGRNNRIKRLFIHPERIFHNGIVKRPSDRKETEMLGPTVEHGGALYLTDLNEDLLAVPREQMNTKFQAWQKVLADYAARAQQTSRAAPEFRRLWEGRDEVFAFFNDAQVGLEMRCLAPIVEDVQGRPALRFLRTHRDRGRQADQTSAASAAATSGLSASHTINGHSVVLMLRYGHVRYLFSGDLNDEAEERLLHKHVHGSVDLRAEVLKVPHHGSADFSGPFLQAVSPLVSIVSSGDESAAKEYIHPRASLVGALGRCGRGSEPLIFVTELVAFFRREGRARLADEAQNAKRGEFYGFSRSAFGMVKTRTDGRRLLVYTDSGNVKLKEAYAFLVDAQGATERAAVVRV